ncbi:hypothetical protein AB0I35_31885 [Nocardia sp. NPDC050378]|uniref:hypothetical protein n=1 Tax=Nocardia sp. NPDC050378 TaxID=3155400 RepID=UPI0033CEFEC5
MADHDAEIANGEAGYRAPVPRVSGDRRTSGDPVADIGWPNRPVPSGALLWPPAADLVNYLNAGQLENSNSVIHHVATEAAPAVAANAVITCRDLDLPAAVDSIISYAGRRNDRDVLQILRQLLQHERHTDAGALLDRALGALADPEFT